MYDINLGDSSTGVVDYDESNEGDLLLGLDYVDVHSDAYPDGELRGQIDSQKIVSSDGLLSLTVPTYMIPPGIDITIRKLGADELPAELSSSDVPVQFAYEFGPDGLTFDEPVTVEMKLDDTASVGGDIESGLIILASLSGGKLGVLDTQGMNIDVGTNEKKAIGKIKHFSKLVGVLMPGISASISGVPGVADVDTVYPVGVKLESTPQAKLSTSAEVEYEDRSRYFARRVANVVGFLDPGGDTIELPQSYGCSREGVALFSGTIHIKLGGLAQDIFDRYNTYDPEYDPIESDYSITGNQSLICLKSGSNLARGTANAAIDTGLVGGDSIKFQADYSVQPVEINETVGNSFDLILSEAISNLSKTGNTRLDMDMSIAVINPEVISKTSQPKNVAGTAYVKLVEEEYGVPRIHPRLAINALGEGLHTQTLQYTCLKVGDSAVGITTDISVEFLKKDSKPDDYFRRVYSSLEKDFLVALVHCAAPSGTSGGISTTETAVVNIADGIPTGAIAWKVVNAAHAHTDGPFALPGAANPNGYNVLDPTDSATFATSHWANPDECTYVHLHGTFQGHGDPDTACGHGGLVFIVTQ